MRIYGLFIQPLLSFLAPLLCFPLLLWQSLSLAMPTEVLWRGDFSGRFRPSPLMWEHHVYKANKTLPCYLDDPHYTKALLSLQRQLKVTHLKVFMSDLSLAYWKPFKKERFLQNFIAISLLSYPKRGYHPRLSEEFSWLQVGCYSLSFSEQTATVQRVPVLELRRWL
ncbi:MAG: hypothetical protein VW378_05520 [bacterium]